MSEGDSKSFDIFLQAAKSGDIKILTKLLHEGVDYAKNQFQSLTEASREDNGECVRLLLERATKDHPFPKDIMLLSGCSCAPVTAAIENYNSEVVEILMELYCKATAEELGYAFSSACKQQDTKCLEIIVAKLSNQYREMLDEAEHKGMPPLHMAIKSKNLKAMEVLLKGGADPDVEPKHNGNDFPTFGTRSYDVSRALAVFGSATSSNNELRYQDLPLHYAARCGDVMAIAALLHFGAHPGICNGVQEVPVVTAIRCSRNDCVKTLSLFTPPRFVSQVVVELAMDRNIDCLEFLFKKGFPTFASSSGGNDDALTDWRTILFPENWSSEVMADEDLAKTVNVLVENGTDFHGIATSSDFFLPMFFKRNILKTLKAFCDYGLVEMHCDCRLSGDFMEFSTTLHNIMTCLIDMQRELDFDDPMAFFLEEPDLTGLNPLPSLSIFMDHFPFAKLNSDNVPLRNLHKELAPVVPPLKKICRWTIRCTIVGEHRMVSETHVSQLGLPKALRNFVLYL